MHTLIKSFIITITMATVACSKQGWYEGVKAANKSNCLKQPDSEYQDCIADSDDSYEQYNRKREELINENRVKEKQ